MNSIKLFTISLYMFASEDPVLDELKSYNKAYQKSFPSKKRPHLDALTPRLFIAGVKKHSRVLKPRRSQFRRTSVARFYESESVKKLSFLQPKNKSMALRYGASVKLFFGWQKSHLKILKRPFGLLLWIWDIKFPAQQGGTKGRNSRRLEWNQNNPHPKRSP